MKQPLTPIQEIQKAYLETNGCIYLMDSLSKSENIDNETMEVVGYEQVVTFHQHFNDTELDPSADYIQLEPDEVRALTRFLIGWLIINHPV